VTVRRERILVQFEDGHISRDELRAKLAKVDADRLRIDAAEQEAASSNVLASAEVRRALLKELATVRKVWRHATPAERREFVNMLATAVGIAKGKKSAPVWRSAEDLAADVC
jgi:hypothetical protein